MRCAGSRNQRQAGFSFAEVMFAVVILGVGFIMIAAMFPVALRQSKSTVDETSAAAAARVSANDMGLLASDNLMGALGANPNTVQVMSLPTRASATADIVPSTTLWEGVRGNVISPTDPRYAWVPFVFRSVDSLPPNRKRPYAELILVCVQATNKPTFTDDDIRPKPLAAQPENPLRANLRGRPVRIMIINSPSPDPDFIGFAEEKTLPDKLPAGQPYSGVNAVAEGCFVIIRQAPAGTNGSLTGRIFRVGVRRPDLDAPAAQQTNVTSSGSPSVMLNSGPMGLCTWYELDPRNDFTVEAAGAAGASTIPAVDPPTNVPAWVVGRSLADPNDITKGYEGPAMDVSAYSTIVFCQSTQ